LRSVPLAVVLLVVGAVLGMRQGRAERKASRRPGRLTTVALRLNVASLVIGGILTLAILLWFVAVKSGLPQ